MYSKLRNNRVIAAFVSTVVCLASCLCVRAEWGSIRANNRAPHEVHVAPHVEAPHATATPGRERNTFRAPEETRVPEHEAAPRNFEAERHWAEQSRESRHLDMDEDRRHGYYWSGISPGAFFSVLPSGYISINVGGNPYYYYGGAYYQPGPSGYVAVTPPIGAVVPTLPPGAEPIPVGQNMFYYANGAFYLPEPQGLVVVAPPTGVTVGYLPSGATPVYLGGRLFYEVGGVYFEPEIQGGVTVYRVAQP